MGGLLFPPPQRHRVLSEDGLPGLCIQGEQMGQEGKVAPRPSPPASRDTMEHLQQYAPAAPQKPLSPIRPTPRPQQGIACPAQSHLPQMPESSTVRKRDWR